VKSTHAVGEAPVADPAAGPVAEPPLDRPAAHRRRWRLAPWVYGLALVLWASSWNLRLSVVLDWLPVEPVWVGAGAVALCVVHRFGQPLRLPVAVAAPILLLALGFLPGALLSSGDGYGPDKVAAMLLVLLPVVLAATVLLDSRESRRGWVYAQVLIGGAVAVAALEFNHPTQVLEPGRFTLASVDTISTARLVGVAVVALLLLGLGSLKKSWWALPLAAACGMVLVHVGSRGPLLGVLVAVMVVLVVGRCFAGRRVLFVLAAVAASYGAFRYALVAGGAGGKRIIGSLETGFSDNVRAQLLHDAVRLGSQHPMGIGWGDFAQDGQAGRDIANQQGVAYAHNVFAEAFSEGGVLALLVLVLVVVLALWRLQRLSSDPVDAVVLGILVYWLFNAQVSSDFVGNRFMWIALACGVAAYVPRRRVSVPAPRTRAVRWPAVSRGG
jgi:O-antigen ligase